MAKDDNSPIQLYNVKQLIEKAGLPATDYYVFNLMFKRGASYPIPPQKAEQIIETLTKEYKQAVARLKRNMKKENP